MKNERKDEEQFGIDRQKLEKGKQYRDIKPAEQSGDNDMDRVSPENDKAKEETDKAYLKQGNKSGISPDQAAE